MKTPPYPPFARPFKIMANGDLRILVENAAGSLQEVVIPKGTSKMLGTDAAGGLILKDPPLVPKADKVVLATIDAGSKTITFATPFPAGTTYNVIVHFNGSALIYTVTAATVGSFTFTYLATLTGTAYWTAVPYSN